MWVKWCVNSNGSISAIKDVANGAVSRDRVYRDREEVLAQDHDCFISCFRDPRTVLTVELGPHLEHDPARSRFLPVPTQVLTTFGFPDGGSFQ